MTGPLAPLRAALVAAALLAGLFAMHGLTHHGEHLPAAGVTEQTAAHADHQPGHQPGHQGTTPVAGAPEGSGHADLGAMTLCLFVLVVGGLAWLVVRHPGGRPLVVRRSRPRLPPSVRAATRAHDPPDLTTLSVCRC